MRKSLQRLGVAVTLILAGLVAPALGTAPAAADPPEWDTIQERKQIFIDRAIAAGWPTTDLNQRKLGGYAAMAQFHAGEIATGREFVTDHLELTNDMFWGMNVMEPFMRYGNTSSEVYYDQAMKNTVKQRIFAFNILNAAGDFLGGSTENHHLMYSAVGVMAGQVWPEYKTDPVTKPRYDEARAYLTNRLPRIVKLGYWEHDSTGYFIHHVGPLMFLSEYLSDSDPLKDMARMTLEWYFASIVGEYLKGSIVGTSGRTSNPMQSPGFNRLADTADLLWVLFGGSRLPVVPGSDVPTRHALMPFLVGDWELPDIFKRIALDRDQTYTHREKTEVNPNRPSKTSYVTPDYALYSQRDDNEPAGTDAGPRWGLKWVTTTNADEPSTFFLKHPPSNIDPVCVVVNGKEDEDCDDYWMGNSPYEDVLQDDGTMIAVYNIPTTDPHAFIDGPVSRAVLDTTVARNGWLYVHTGSMIFGVKAINSLAWNDATTGWFFHNYVRVLRSAGRKNGLIVETARVSEFASPEINTVAEQIDAFADDIEEDAVVNDDHITETNPRLIYTNRHGRVMDIVMNVSRHIDGVLIDYAGWPLLDNPWMHQDFNTPTLTIGHDGETRTYHFDTWTTSDTMFSDDFEDNDSVSWEPPDGWDVITAGGSRKFRQRWETASNTVAANGWQSWENYRFEAQIQPLTISTSTPTPTIGILARYTDNNNRYGFMWSNGQLLITKVVNGTLTTLDSAPFTLTAGTTYTFRAEVDGGALRFYVNNVLRAGATDSAIQSGRIALAMRNVTALYDNVTVNSL